MTCKRLNQTIKQICLYFYDSSGYIYMGCTNKRLTKRMMTFIHEWRSANEDENEDKIERMKGQVKVILDYLDQSKVFPFIDMTLDNDRNDSIDNNDESKEEYEDESKEDPQVDTKEERQEERQEEQQDTSVKKIIRTLVEENFKPSNYIYYGDLPILEIELTCGCVYPICIHEFDIY